MCRNPRLVIWFVVLACTSSGCRPGQPPAAVPVVANSQPDQLALMAVDPSAADLEALQGWWEIIEDKPEDGAPGAPPGDKLLIESNKTYLFNNYGDLGIQVDDGCICVRLDATKTPKQMDRWHVKITDGSFSRAIYQLDADMLTEVYGAPEPDGRPTKLDDPTKHVRKYRRSQPPKQVKLNGDAECRPKLDTKHAPSEIVR